MRKTKNRLLLVLTSLLVCNVMLLAQVKRTISGVVKDNSGKPVPSATVTIKGTAKSVTTDLNGQYNIAVDNTNAVLVISSVGLATKELKVGTLKTLDATLEIDASEMGGVLL